MQRSAYQHQTNSDTNEVKCPCIAHRDMFSGTGLYLLISALRTTAWHQMTKYAAVPVLSNGIT